MTSLRDDVSVCSADDGMVLLDERSGRYWQLNVTGAEVLSALLSGATPQEVAARLAASRAVDEQRAAADVAALLDQLVKAGLVRVS